MTAPPPPPLPPELIAALKERNLGKVIRVLLQPQAGTPPGRVRARPAPGPDAGAVPSRRPAAPQLPHSRGRELSPGEVPRSGAAFWFWLVLLLLGYLGYRLWPA